MFNQFDMVVILDTQNRATDQKWINILDKIRVGECNQNDIEEIQKLVLTNPNCIQPDFQVKP
jgi:hypothetical protein